MSAEAGTETDHTPKGMLLNAAKVIEYAEDYLSKACDETQGYDPEIVKQIDVERKFLDAFLTQLKEAQMITDEVLFNKAAGALKLQAASLKAASDRIKRIASDVATSQGVTSYMEQAVTFIAQAMIFLAALP